MTFTPKPEMFANDELSVSYGDGKEAVFHIIDESFPGSNVIGRVNMVTCIVNEYDGQGNISATSRHGTIIGMGDNAVGVTAEDPALLGKQMARDNMESCTVILYED